MKRNYIELEEERMEMEISNFDCVVLCVLVRAFQAFNFIDVAVK